MSTAARVSAGTAVGLSGLLFVVHATNDAFSSMLSALLPTLQVRFGSPRPSWRRWSPRSRSARR
jgi:hypothetical protein